MTFIFGVVSILISLSFSNHSEAAAGDGTHLLTGCKKAELSATGGGKSLAGDTDWMEIAHCYGLIEGIVTLNRTYQRLLGKAALFCLPRNGLSSGQGARVVTKFLDDHPAKLHEHGAALAVQAFMQAFPCK